MLDEVFGTIMDHLNCLYEIRTIQIRLELQNFNGRIDVKAWFPYSRNNRKVACDASPIDRRSVADSFKFNGNIPFRCLRHIDDVAVVAGNIGKIELIYTFAAVTALFRCRRHVVFYIEILCLRCLRCPVVTCSHVTLHSQ